MRPTNSFFIRRLVGLSGTDQVVTICAMLSVNNSIFYTQAPQYGWNLNLREFFLPLKITLFCVRVR